MAMSKQDFIAIADVLKQTRPMFGVADSIADCELDGKQWRFDVEAIAGVLAKANPRFKRERWLSYIAGECGPNGGAVKA